MAGKKVLIVDDSETARLQMKVVLKSLSFDVLEAVDGLDGLEKLANHSDIALVFCDVNMPNLDGLGMVEALCKTAKASGQVLPPIIMLTTESAPTAVIRGRNAGVRGWLLKPPQPAKIIDLVTKIRLI